MKRAITLLACLQAVLPAANLTAAFFPVSNTLDDGPGSLRQAIIDANATGGEHTISCTNISGTIVLASPLPQLTRPVTVLGPGAAALTVNGSNAFQVFRIASGARVTLSALTIAQGYATNSGGGGVFNAGLLTLADCTLSSNRARGFPGGAIFNQGDLTMSGATLRDNIAQGPRPPYWYASYISEYGEGAGGGIHVAGGSVNISNSTLTSNAAWGGITLDMVMNAWGHPGVGGAVSVGGGALTVFNSTVSDNSARGSTGVILGGRWGASGAPGIGGGLCVASNGTAWLVNCTFSANQAIGSDGQFGVVGGGSGGDALGGGIYSASSNVFMMNCTIHANVVRGGTNGGSPVSPGWPGMASGPGTYGVARGGIVGLSSIIQSPGGYFSSQGYNLLESRPPRDPLSDSDVVSNSFGLGPLQDNGGQTLTHAALLTSPALERGSSAGAPASDQRGMTRPQSFRTDIGAFELEANGPTEILSFSSDLDVPAGTNVTLEVRALAAQPAGLQWLHNGSVISGATDTTLRLTDVQPHHSGGYEVVVSNAFGATSASMMLIVRTWPVGPPVITNLSPNQAALAGTNLVLSVSAFGAEPLSFLWRKNGVIIPGGIHHTLAIPHVGADDAGDYSVVVWNGYGAITSRVVSVTIIHPIRVAIAGGGTVAKFPDQLGYPAGEHVTLVATPAAEWEFLHWLGVADGTNSLAEVTVTPFSCVEAVFGTRLKTNVSGNGWIAADPLLPLYPYGTVVRLTAVPMAGHHFASWAGGSTSGSPNPLLFPVITAETTVSAVFAPLGAGETALTVNLIGRGHVTTSPAGNRFTTNQTVMLSAFPDADQAFLGWSGDASGTETNLAVLMDQSKIITATFTTRPRLTIDPCCGVRDGDALRLMLTGEFGVAYRIDRSTTLPTWTPWTTITSTFGRSQVTDGPATNPSPVFYRAVSPP